MDSFIHSFYNLTIIQTYRSLLPDSFNHYLYPFFFPASPKLKRNMSNILILNDENTKKGEIPKLDRNAKEKIKTVKILSNSNIHFIPDEFVQGYTSLESIYIESDVVVTSIGKRAFHGCTSLKVIEIPNSVEHIGEHAFSGCTSLESIEIPKGVTSIGRGAFQGCTVLQSIFLQPGLPPINSTSFL